MEDAFGDLSGGFDDLLFPSSFIAAEDPLFAPLEPVSAGVPLPNSRPAPTGDDMRRSVPAHDAAPSPSSPAGFDATSDSKAKRKAEQNRRADFHAE